MRYSSAAYEIFSVPHRTNNKRAANKPYDPKRYLSRWSTGSCLTVKEMDIKPAITGVSPRRTVADVLELILSMKSVPTIPRTPSDDGEPNHQSTEELTPPSTNCKSNKTRKIPAFKSAQSPREYSTKYLFTSIPHISLDPAMDALGYCLYWMDFSQWNTNCNQHYQLPVPQSASLESLINIYAAALHLRMRPPPYQIRHNVMDALTQIPPTAAIIQRLWSLLPHEDVVTTRAVTSCTYHYIQGNYTSNANTEIDRLVAAHAKLGRKFHKVEFNIFMKNEREQNKNTGKWKSTQRDGENCDQQVTNRKEERLLDESDQEVAATPTGKGRIRDRPNVRRKKATERRESSLVLSSYGSD